MGRMTDKILKAVNQELPQFNEYLLTGFKKEQIDRCTSYMTNCFQEAVKLFGENVELKSVKILTPHERIMSIFFNSKFNASVEVTNTNLNLVEFTFVAWKTTYKTQMYLPYLEDNAITINGSKYYLIFPLTDRVFYHMIKEDGIGIKVLRAHMTFYRNLKYLYTAVSGTKYHDYVIITKIHQKAYKYTSDDIRTSLLLYSLVKYGWETTISKYHMQGLVDFCNYVDTKDTEHEYFEFRKSTKDTPGLYMKVHNSAISPTPDSTQKNAMRVITNLHYCMQYFVRFSETMYQDNVELVKLLKESLMPWRVILGKTIYGISYESELQAAQHTATHLISLDSYLDDNTKLKLEEIGIYCKDSYELLDYVFFNIDDYVINYTPSNLYNKRINIIELLLGNVVRSLFTKLYNKTNSRKSNNTDTVMDTREIARLFSVNTRAIYQISKCTQVVAGSPATYNDNYLLTVGLRKTRATHSFNSGGTKVSDSKAMGRTVGRQNANLLSSPAHRLHPSWLEVESLPDVNTQNPGIGGSINTFLQIDDRGKIIKSDWGKELDELKPYLISS